MHNLLLLERTRRLAVEMIRLERLTLFAREAGNLRRAAELWTTREGARERRSSLLRELWAQRRLAAATTVRGSAAAQDDEAGGPLPSRAPASVVTRRYASDAASD